MLTDRQSIILCIVVVLSFVIGGILNILDKIYIAIPILIIFLIIIINLLVTKKAPDLKEEQTIIKQEDNQ